MIINHPLLGARDSEEFTYLGDASLINRPDAMAVDSLSQFIEYGYFRDNVAGQHQELWFHEQGDRSWLVVTRDTVTHDIIKVELASVAARKKKGDQNDPKK